MAAAALEADGGAQARQLHVAHERAADLEQPHQAACVARVLHHHAAAHIRGVGNGDVALRNDGAPLGGRAVAGIHGDHASARRGVGSLKIQLVVLRAQERVKRIPGREQRQGRGVRPPQILHEHGVRIVAIEQADDEVAAVLGDLRRGHARRMIRDPVDELVGGLRLVQLVKVHLGAARIVAALRLFHFLPGLQRITAVVHARAVARPGHRPELAELEHHRQIDAARDIAEVPDVPVRAAVRERVGQPLAIGARLPLRQRDGGIVALAVRVDQHARRCVERVGHVQHALVLRAVVAQVEIFAALASRHAEALVSPELLEPFAQPGSLRQSFEKRLRQRVLGGHPVARALRAGVFEPAIRIRHAHAVVDVDHLAARRRGIDDGRRRGRWRVRRCLRCGAVAHATEQCGERARGAARSGSEDCSPSLNSHNDFAGQCSKRYARAFPKRRVFSSSRRSAHGCVAGTLGASLAPPAQAEKLTLERLFAAPDLCGSHAARRGNLARRPAHRLSARARGRQGPLRSVGLRRARVARPPAGRFAHARGRRIARCRPKKKRAASASAPRPIRESSNTASRPTAAIC